MADITTTSYDLKLECYFVDGDTRNIMLKNPSPSIAAEDIASLQSFMQTEQPILGDKNKAAFGKIKKATRIQTTSYYLDIDH